MCYIDSGYLYHRAHFLVSFAGLLLKDVARLGKRAVSWLSDLPPGLVRITFANSSVATYDTLPGCD